MSRPFFLLLLHIFCSACIAAQELSLLQLPDGEQLPRVATTHVLQDAEGALWYATEGGGLCRDDGHGVSVFRSDADNPDLLGSNKVACIAEAGHYIVVGTFHGAYLLDKADYSIRRMAEVDDKRVDDILVLRSGDVLLTANQKIFRFSATLQLKHTYSSPGKYVAHLFEDARGRVWATQWDGGLLKLRGGEFVAAPWPVAAAPTDLADAPGGRLWIGTVGGGVVSYQPDHGTAEEQPATAGAVCIDLQPSLDGRRLWLSTTSGLRLFEADAQLRPVPMESLPSAATRLSLDSQGRLLIAASRQPLLAIGSTTPWPLPAALDPHKADSLRAARHLKARPTAMTWQGGTLWFSTGHDIRRQPGDKAQEEVVLGKLKDVSAMAFAPDGTLWLGTIFGVLYAYREGRLLTDHYGSNEHGDAVVALGADSTGMLTIVYDRYARRYDTQRHTLRQQSIEPAGTYRIELQETLPYQHWSQPAHETTTERMPHWGWWVLAVLCLLLMAMQGYVWFLHRQRRIFLNEIKKPEPLSIGGQQESAPDTTGTAAAEAHTASTPLPQEDEPIAAPRSNAFLKKAIAQIESHLSDDNYTVEQLAADLCMSRMTFYRKIQMATGQKPTEFIRTVRLRHAANLLREGSMTISEIGYASGFSSVSYFSRCFRTMYGVSPTQYVASAATPQQVI